METNQIVICPNCFDMWRLENLNYLNTIDFFSILSKETDCHRCGKNYIIKDNCKTNMFNWVFNKVKTIKGE